MEKKLDLTTFTDDECVGAAAHQLIGVAHAWWDSFSDSHEDPANISWEEFTEVFTEYHIPKGIMEAKAEEFRNIKMGKDWLLSTLLVSPTFCAMCLPML
jgi:hypothetical protein